MLKFSDQNEAQAADQVRVRPHELMEALRTVEARKEAEARAQEETVPLGQAMEALGVHHTPEEVLEALQAYRARESRMKEGRSRRPVRKRTVATVGMIAVLSLTVVIGASWCLMAVRAESGAAAAKAVVSPASAGNATIGFQTRRLSEIGEGDTFRCDITTLMRLANGIDGPETVVEVGAEQDGLWTAMRTASGIKIQGVMTPADALKLANGEDPTLYRNGDIFSSSSSYTSVQVPLERLRNISSNTDNSFSLNPISGSP